MSFLQLLTDKLSDRYHNLRLSAELPIPSVKPSDVFLNGFRCVLTRKWAIKGVFWRAAWMDKNTTSSLV